MPFIDKSILKKKVEAATVQEHPLLKEVEVDVATKIAYLQGCVLASLIDDAHTSDSERAIVKAIGFSLGMTDIEIDECFSIVKGLSNDEEKSRFIDEITGLLQRDIVSYYFMKDFESIVETGGASEFAGELIDYIGALIYKSTNWRQEQDAKEQSRILEKLKIEEEAKKKREEARVEAKRKEAERLRAEQERIENEQKAQAHLFCEKTVEIMSSYRDDGCVPYAAWKGMKGQLLQAGITQVSIPEIVRQMKETEIEAYVSLNEIHNIEKCHGWRVHAIEAAFKLCALCCIKKDITVRDMDSFEEVMRIARKQDGSGWFEMETISKTISEILGCEIALKGGNGLGEIY